MPPVTESIPREPSTLGLDPLPPAGDGPTAPEGEGALASERVTPAGEPPRDDRSALPPSLRDRFRDAAFVGQGGMGTVLRAHDVRLGRDVAVKLLKRSEDGGTPRFLQEARAQARIQHDNVCPIYDAGEADGQPFIVMPLLDGVPLDEARGAGGAPLSLEEKVRLVREVAAAVHEAHRAGLIHRDLKPSNILVERRADGALKPYVVDFGLAREVSEHGRTSTGAVVGTPAFMSPEQARGETRSLDRRTDVYALGATLYKLVAGRTPFLADPPWKVLSLVTTEDPPPLRSVFKGAPEDLDTIVMKCLERDPGRRYDSARALAEDLQRFLDGEPLSARRSRLHALWKSARRHKLATSLAAAAIVAIASVTLVWAKGRRDAAEEARVAQAIGEDVKEMELFLRAAYELPLHDIERERAMVRLRLADIESRARSSRGAARAAASYAIGRGHLALGDPETARIRLVEARAEGYGSPELSYALGVALGEIYRREKARVERLAGDEERRARESALREELVAPALAALREARGATREPAALVEGLIAYHEDRPEQALAKAREAFAEAPWLYEAKRLEGDALAAMARPFGHDAAASPAELTARLGAAVEAYGAAAEIGRSDPAVHRAECDAWTRLGLSEQVSGKSAEPSYERAIAACDRAVKASPGDPSVIAQRAFTLWSRADASADRGGPETLSLVDAALRASEQAVRASPEDALARYDLARSAFLREEQRSMCGLAVSTAAPRAAYEATLALDPRFTWAIAELGDVLALEGEIASRRGDDPTRPLDEALAQYERARKADAKLTAPLGGEAHVHVLRAEHLLRHGASPEPAIEALLGVVGQLDKREGHRWHATYWRARAHRLRARHDLARGRDPGPSVRDTLATLESLGQESQADYWILRERAEALLIEAQHLVTTDRDPADPLAGARKAADAAALAKPMHVVPREIQARAALAALRWSLRRGTAAPRDFEAVMEPLRPLFKAGSADPRLLAVRAELMSLRAEAQR